MVNYSEVVADLRAKGQELLSIAAALERLMDGGEQAAPVETAGVVTVDRPAEPEAIAEKEEPEPARRKFNTHVVPSAPAEPKQTSISDLIRQVIHEPAERTATEVADRVLLLRPEARRDTISTIISQMQSKGEIRKTDDMKVRFVVNNRLQEGAASA